jgi:hypothetical protein
MAHMGAEPAKIFCQKGRIGEDCQGLPPAGKMALNGGESHAVTDAQ